MSFQVYFLVLCVVCSSHALLYSRSDHEASSNGREVDESCLALADLGSCEFYSCFENRLPCGREWYILRQGRYYCEKIQRMMEDFPEEVELFLQEAQTCLTQSLKTSYRADRLSCHDLEHEAVGEIASCFNDNAFCSVLRGNHAHFFSIYEPTDLISTGAGKVWREIARLTSRCARETFVDIASSAREQISETADDFLESASDFAGSIRDRFTSLFDKKK